jgi:hypothetical protein
MRTYIELVFNENLHVLIRVLNNILKVIFKLIN